MKQMESKLESHLKKQLIIVWDCLFFFCVKQLCGGSEGCSRHLIIVEQYLNDLLNPLYENVPEQYYSGRMGLTDSSAY